MELVKYCKEEHNIRNGCNTLQLGTFDYYRELDPAFSIADVEEGVIKYVCKAGDDLVINSRQFNAITGGGVKIIDKDSPNPASPLGSVKILLDGGEYVGQPDGTVKIKPGNIDVEINYPNCYIFCCSIIDGEELPSPKAVSSEYDSFYKISSKNIEQFGGAICKLIAEDLQIGNIKFDDQKLLESHVLTLGQAPNIRFIHGPIDYVDEKTIKLEKPEDFDENNWTRIFFRSMLKKDASYTPDKEYRFVFVIEHPAHRMLPVKSQPKLLGLNPLHELTL